MVLPAVEAEDILKSASVPPVHVTSMLTPVAESSEQGEPEEDTNDERRILSGRVQLPKVNSEAQSLENLRRPADLPRWASTCALDLCAACHVTCTRPDHCCSA